MHLPLAPTPRHLATVSNASRMSATQFASDGNHQQQQAHQQQIFLTHQQQQQQQQQQHSQSNTLDMSSSQPYSFFSGLGNPNMPFGPPSQNTLGGTPAPTINNSNPANDLFDDVMLQNPSQSMLAAQSMNNQTPLGSNISDHSQSLGSLKVADLIQILQPIQDSVQDIKTSINQQLGTLQNKVNIMEEQLKKEIAKNEQLTGVIINMQKSINQIDSDKRVKNLIINGLPEGEIVPEGTNQPITEEKAKFQTLVHKIGIMDIDEACETFEFSRIGNPVNGKTRLLKINVGSKEMRDKICDESKKLKLLPEPWKKIYINKDVHPVYLKENQRIRKAMQELKKVPGYEHQTGRVKLENGKLTVDGRVVDNNLFFNLNSVSRVTILLKLCFWNMNGVKNKFMSATTNDVIQDTDILIISETHFNIRIKCPENFVSVEKSPPTESKRPRGGVAIYKKIHCALQFTTLLNIQDCTVCEINNTNTILIAIYIPPNNSQYFNEDIFEHLKSMLTYFLPHKSIYIVGDMNSRFGNMNTNVKPQLRYKINPDTSTNQNGLKLIKILQEFPEMVLLNGLHDEYKKFDSDFTFFRGNKATQIDICITNNTINTDNLKILHKNPISDHTPVLVTFKTDLNPPLDLIDSCASKFLSYDHYDINRKLRRPIKLENCNLLNLVTDLERLGNKLLQEFDGPIDSKTEVENLNSRITDGIYEACQRNRRKESLSQMIPREAVNLHNCNSKNFQAIADANGAQFNRLLEINDPHADTYKETWLNFQEMAFLKGTEEFSKNNCNQWKQ